LPHKGQGFAGARPEDRRIGGYRAPAKKREIEFRNRGAKSFYRVSFLARLKKHHADAEFFRQLDPVRESRIAEKSFWNPGQQTGAITAAPIGIHTSAVRQAFQSAEPAFDYGMRRWSAELRDEAHAARVMIVRECRATFRHVIGLNGNAAKVQSSILMRWMCFFARWLSAHKGSALYG